MSVRPHFVVYETSQRVLVEFDVKANVERFCFVHIGPVFGRSDLDAMAARIFLC
jgi:hypothetical protein